MKSIANKGKEDEKENPLITENKNLRKLHKNLQKEIKNIKSA